jgi:hypothetical protein
LDEREGLDSGGDVAIAKTSDFKELKRCGEQVPLAAKSKRHTEMI